MQTKRWLLGIGFFSLFFAALSAPTAEARRARLGDQIELGRRLFLDPSVSRMGEFSCASCHEPEHGFSDPRRFSVDENGTTRRHSQTVLNLVDGRGMHWDGEFDTVRELLTARIAVPETAIAQALALHQRHFAAATARGSQPNRSEFTRRTRELTPPYYGPPVAQQRAQPLPMPVAMRLNQDERYGPAFRRAFGRSQVGSEEIITALEAYLLSLRSTRSPFDDFLAGDPGAVSASARRGYQLFTGKANCASCHTVTGDRPRFTDDEFHNTGVSFRALPLELNRRVSGDGGFGEMSFAARDLGRFKTPGLRDVARRAPYMHDGSFQTLEEVVRYYDEGGTVNKHLDEAIAPLRLDDGEVADLVAFLESLSGRERAGIGRPARGTRATRVRLRDVQGRPIAGQIVTVEPFGDRLAGAATSGPPLIVRSDKKGWLEFDFPLWTHVKLRAEGLEIGLDRPLPDSARKFELTAAPRDRVTLRLIGPPKMSAMPQLVTARVPNDKRKAVVTVFRRVRALSGHEAIYTARLPAGRYRKRLDVFLDVNPILRRIDFSGGESDPIATR